MAESSMVEPRRRDEPRHAQALRSAQFFLSAARGRLRGCGGIHGGLDGGKKLASNDLLVDLAEGVEVGKALVYLGAAPLALSPQPHVHDKASATDVEHLER